MTDQINSKYLENYSSDYASEVCNSFFASKQYISGQDIVQLTNSIQVNFFVLKRLFGLWQEEIDKLKSNPFFDYRDITVHEALTQFMNVLSKRIKVERSQFEPLVKYAVGESIKLATDPVDFYQKEIAELPGDGINTFLKENQKYYKWHLPVINFLIDKTGFGHDKEAYFKSISSNYKTIQDDLESVNLLMATLGDIKPFDLDLYLGTSEKEEIAVEEKANRSFFDEVSDQEPEPMKTQKAEVEKKEVIEEKEEIAEEKKSRILFTPEPRTVFSNGTLSASKLRAKYESDSYKGSKGVVVELSEGLALNQRFMFTKELFEGNSDLMMHTLKTIDQSGSFDEAIALINSRYLGELNWEPETDAVQEFLQLVYRRFDGI